LSGRRIAAKVVNDDAYRLDNYVAPAIIVGNLAPSFPRDYVKNLF
jgi:hypothetical protein